MKQITLKRRRPGKIANLPADVREQLNAMLQDGVTYKDIIARLGDAAKNLNKDNLSRWRKADHQDWLQDQVWRQLRSLPAKSGKRVPESAARQLFDINYELDPQELAAKIAHDPDNFCRLTHLMMNCGVIARQLDSTTLASRLPSPELEIEPTETK